MRKNIKAVAIIGMFLLLAALATSALAAPQDQAQDQKGIVDMATEQGQFTTLLGALEKANLVDRLKGEGPFTVFAPTDEAFARLPEGTVDGWFANAQALNSVLLDHVVEGRLTAADLAKMDTVQSLTGRTLDITVDGDKIQVNGANVTTADLAASNGVIHVIDTVLAPPTGNEAAMQEEVISQTTPGQAPSAAGCAENYVVQANDSLSKIAEKFLGDLGAYQNIVEATNTVAADNQTYVTIDDPNLISVGQTLCIPGSPQAQTAAGEQEAVTPTTPTDSGAQAAANQPNIEVPEGKAMLIFENYAFVDLVFDLSGPMPDSATVVPDGKQPFILEPGLYNYNAHQPGGDYSVAPGTFELEAGEVMRLACSDSPVCAVLPFDETVEPSAAGQE